MRRLAYFILSLVGLAALAAAGLWLLVQSDSFWTWGAHRLVGFAQDRLYPTLTVQEARGHPLTGLTFRGISLTGPEGEILRAERLEISFSLWSFVRLRPVIGRVAVFQPHLKVWREPDGQVNLARIFRPRPPPPFQSVDVLDLLLAGVMVELHRQSEVTRYGPADFQAAFTVLHPKRPEQALLIRRASVVYDDPRGQLKFATRMTYSRQQLSILDLEARVAEELLARFTGQGNLEDQPAGAGTLEVGPASGQLLHRFLPGWPATWPVTGTFRLDLSPAGLQASGAGQVEETPFSLTGKVVKEAGEWRYGLEVDTPALALGLLEPWRPAWAQTLRSLPPVPVRLSGQGAGLSWPPAALDWNLAVGAVTWRGVHLAAGQASLRGSASQAVLQVQARGSFGKLAAALSGPWLTEARGQVLLEAEAAQPALLGLAVPAGTQITGRFAGALSLPHWDPGRLSLKGELAVHGRVGDLPVQEAKARLAWEQGRLDLSQGNLKAGNLVAEVSGRLSAAGPALQARGRLLGPPPLGPPLRMSGASFALALTGPWRLPEADFTVELKDPAWQELTSHSLSLKGTIAGWPPVQGRGTMRVAGLKTPVGAFSEGSFTAQGEASRWRLTGRARGAAENRLEIAGLLDAGGRPLNLSLDRLEFKVGQFSGRAQGPVRLAFAPGLRLEPATLKVNGARLSGEARLNEGALTARLEGADLPGELISLQGVPLQGKINGRATLSGSAARPILEGEVALSRGGWGRLEISTLKAGLTYGDGSLRVAGSLEESRRKSRLALEGRLPWRFSLMPLMWRKGDGELKVLLRGENFNLALLPSITREVTEADLPMEFQAQWQGPAARPTVTGFCRWGDGTITFRLGGARYQVAAGAARLEGSTLTIPELRFQSGGEARISGTIGLQGFLPAQVDLRGHLEGFKALSRYGSEASGRGSLTLTGPFADMLLKGQLTVTQAVFRPIFFESGTSEDIVLVRRPADAKAEAPSPGPPEFIRNARMHISLEGENNIWVRDKRANIELGGRLLATKEAGGPVRLRGDLKVLQGTVTVHDKLFTVVAGGVHLPGRPQELTTVEGRAEHQLEEVKLIMEMSGPVAKPLIRLSSLPPLPPADLLSFMVFGQRAASLTKEQYSSVTSQAVGLIGGLTTKKLLDFLGKDFPLLGDLYLKGGPQGVGVGKPLTKDLTVSFERATDPLARYADENQVRLEYRLRKGITVESQLGRRNPGADIFWNFDF